VATVAVFHAASLSALPPCYSKFVARFLRFLIGKDFSGHGQTIIKQDFKTVPLSIHSYTGVTDDYKLARSE
jgi:hypothetical protein